MKTLKTMDLKICSNLENVCCSTSRVLNFLQEYYGNIHENTVYELKVILNELILNAIKHGNQNDENKCIIIRVGITEDCSIFIMVEDEGEGFDYKQILEDDLPLMNFDLDEMKETGRGIRIVKNLCNCMKFNKRGNKVVIVKKVMLESGTYYGVGHILNQH